MRLALQGNGIFGICTLYGEFPELASGTLCCYLNMASFRHGQSEIAHVSMRCIAGSVSVVCIVHTIVDAHTAMLGRDDSGDSSRVLET